MLAQLVACALGILLTASPALLSYGGLAASHDHLVGPFVASLACIAAFEATRSLRFVNVVLGAWLLVAPWALHDPAPALWNSLAIGVLLMLCSVRGRRAEGSLGGGWWALLRADGDEER